MGLDLTLVLSSHSTQKVLLSVNIKDSNTIRLFTGWSAKDKGQVELTERTLADLQLPVYSKSFAISIKKKTYKKGTQVFGMISETQAQKDKHFIQ